MILALRMKGLEGGKILPVAETVIAFSRGFGGAVNKTLGEVNAFPNFWRTSFCEDLASMVRRNAAVNAAVH